MIDVCMYMKYSLHFIVFKFHYVIFTTPQEEFYCCKNVGFNKKEKNVFM